MKSFLVTVFLATFIEQNGRVDFAETHFCFRNIFNRPVGFFGTLYLYIFVEVSWLDSGDFKRNSTVKELPIFLDLSFVFRKLRNTSILSINQILFGIIVHKNL